MSTITKFSAIIGLALSLLVGCDGDGLNVSSDSGTDSQKCQNWGVVETIGLNQGERICLDGQPVTPCHAGEVDHCKCPDGTFTGYQTCGDAGVLNSCVCN
jgi:hypothetical protein